MRPHETIRGRILYTSNKPDREGKERGRENYTINQTWRWTSHAARPLRNRRCAQCAQRRTLTLDKNWTTRDAFVRLSVGDTTVGSSWFCFPTPMQLARDSYRKKAESPN